MKRNMLAPLPWQYRCYRMVVDVLVSWSRDSVRCVDRAAAVTFVYNAVVQRMSGARSLALDIVQFVASMISMKIEIYLAQLSKSEHRSKGIINKIWHVQGVEFMKNWRFSIKFPVVFVLKYYNKEISSHIYRHDKLHAVAADHLSRVLNSPAKHCRRTSRSPHSVANRTFVIHDYTSSRQCSSPAMHRRIRIHNTASNHSDVDNSRTLRDTQSYRTMPTPLDLHLYKNQWHMNTNTRFLQQFSTKCARRFKASMADCPAIVINKFGMFTDSKCKAYLPNDRAIVCGLRDCAFTVYTAMRNRRNKKQISWMLCIFCILTVEAWMCFQCRSKFKYIWWEKQAVDIRWKASYADARVRFRSGAHLNTIDNMIVKNTTFSFVFVYQICLISVLITLCLFI